VFDENYFIISVLNFNTSGCLQSISRNLLLIYTFDDTNILFSLINKGCSNKTVRLESQEIIRHIFFILPLNSP